MRIGFDQQHIVLLMACVSLGGLFLQWPIGYFSDKVDRLYALIGLGAGILAVAAALATVDRQTPFALLALLFAIFGGLAESLYAVGVAHANDRAVMTDYVALSSTLLFVWALGAAIGPTTGTYAIQLIVAARILRLRHRAHARFHAVRGLAAVPPQARSCGRGARGLSRLSANLAGNLCLAALSSRDTWRRKCPLGGRESCRGRRAATRCIGDCRNAADTRLKFGPYV